MYTFIIVGCVVSRITYVKEEFVSCLLPLSLSFSFSFVLSNTKLMWHGSFITELMRLDKQYFDNYIQIITNRLPATDSHS